MAIQKITAKIIADGAIVAADVADGSITNAKIDSVANTKITGLVTSAQIANVANTQLTGSVEATQVGTTVSQLFGTRNRIINGGFDIAQRGTSFTSTSSANNDDTYVLDRWYILSDGNDVVDVTQTTTVPTTGAQYSIGLDVETVNKKFGIAQIIENSNCYGAIGGNVTLSFQAKVSATTKLDNVKCAIVAWSGTADTVTSDIISAWNVEGTNPTLIANATYENTPANLNVTTSFATYSVTAAVDTASTSNLILFVWSDVTDTTLGDFLYITNVQLEIGSTATPFERRMYGQELALCQRYCLKYCGNTALEDVNTATIIGFNATSAYGAILTVVPMRTSPSISSSTMRITDETNTVAVTSIVASGASYSGPYNINCGFNAASGITQFRPYALRAANSTSAFVILSAEL